MAEQYFAAEPASNDVRRDLHVLLRGHEADVEVSNGVFSASRLDLGTSVLLKHAPQPPECGTFLDLGCGWGPIALALALASPQADVWAIDVNERALDLTAVNARRNGCEHVRTARTDAQGLVMQEHDLPGDLRFDLIWSNPPIRIGKEALHTLLMAWLPRLAPGGEAYLVVQRNLGADSLTAWLAQTLAGRFDVDKLSSSKGFRIIAVKRHAK